MKNLILFLSKNKFFLLFIFFEAVALIIVFNNNSFHRSIFLNSTNVITANLNEKVSNVNSYFNLKIENEKLSKENARLLKSYNENFYLKDDSVFVINDTVYKQKYAFINAKIIHNSFNSKNNYLLLDKGKKDGVENGMGVIGAYGVIGIVKDVSGNFSSVLSILHTKSAVSVKLKKNDYLGVVKWNTNNFETANLELIPAHVILNKGDTVVSSGNSMIFPANIPVGSVIESTQIEGEKFQDVKIKFFSKYNQIRHVHIVKNLYRNEIDSLKNKLSEDE